ncbi:MAG: hypothetical protein HOP14_00440 [Acidobacteria bacterium]|nr:hypothetical protein [Acidobacteriota bacterium]
MNGRGWLALLAVVWSAGTAAAQTGEATAARPALDVLPRFDFHLTAEHLSGTDPRFIWDANFGGDLDLVDYGRGRASMVANYQVILGDQIRAFDPNQGNYTLGLSGSWRLPKAEIFGVLHHESRHLSDRPKQAPLDWNMLGVRIQAGGRRGRAETRVVGDVRGVILRSNVDYRWEAVGEVEHAVDVAPRVAVVSKGRVRVLGVDGSFDRGTQTGVRAEGGLRIAGRAGAVELFLAGERRIDPSLFQYNTTSWFMAGFRFLGRR